MIHLFSHFYLFPCQGELGLLVHGDIKNGASHWCFNGKHKRWWKHECHKVKFPTTLASVLGHFSQWQWFSSSSFKISTGLHLCPSIVLAARATRAESPIQVSDHDQDLKSSTAFPSCVLRNILEVLSNGCCLFHLVKEVSPGRRAPCYLLDMTLGLHGVASQPKPW